jgi:chromosome partitioning protein
MLVPTSQGQSGSAHVVVLGNEKGGSGKSTVALHVAVALLKAGQRVATVDLDCRQQSFTRYINNRRAWARRTGLDLELPVHRCIKLGETMQILDNESSEFGAVRGRRQHSGASIRFHRHRYPGVRHLPDAPDALDGQAARGP